MLTPSLQEIAPALQGQFAPSEIGAVTVLRKVPGYAVIRARVRGTDVIFKCWDGAGDVGAARSVATELKRLSQVMNDPNHRVVDVLYDLSDKGVVGMSVAPGHSLSDALRHADATARTALTVQALSWLTINAASTRRSARFAPRFWIQRLDTLPDPGLTAPDRALVDRVMTVLRAQVPVLRGAVVDQAQVHSDFSVFNLHVDGPVVTGFDLHDAPHAPVARAVARLLVSQRLDRLPAPVALQAGADKAMLDAVSASGCLPTEQAARLVPFFIGEYLTDRFLAHYPKEQDRDLRRSRLVSWCQAAPST